MLDLEPATRALTDLVDGMRDDQLAAPTPCREASLGDLIDRLDGLSMAFTAAATKTLLPGGSQALPLTPPGSGRTGVRGSPSGWRRWPAPDGTRPRGLA